MNPHIWVVMPGLNSQFSIWTDNGDLVAFIDPGEADIIVSKHNKIVRSSNLVELDTNIEGLEKGQLDQAEIKVEMKINSTLPKSLQDAKEYYHAKLKT